MEGFGNRSRTKNQQHTWPKRKEWRRRWPRRPRRASRKRLRVSRRRPAALRPSFRPTGPCRGRQPAFGDARNAPPSWTERIQENARQAASHVEKMRFGTSSTEWFDPSYTYASNRGANARAAGPSRRLLPPIRRTGATGGAATSAAAGATRTPATTSQTKRAVLRGAYINAIIVGPRGRRRDGRRVRATPGAGFVWRRPARAPPPRQAPGLR